MAIPSPVLAQSLAVSPGTVTAENVPLGQKIFLHEVEVINGSDTSHVYSIYTKKPATALIRDGYEEIADPTWIEPDKNEIEVKSQSEKAVAIWVRIPNNEANANKNYEGWVIVSEKAMGMIAVEVAVRILLSTSEYNPSLPEEAPPPTTPPPTTTPTTTPPTTPSTTPPSTTTPSTTTPPTTTPPTTIPPTTIPPTEAPPGEPLNRWLIGGIIAAVVVVGLGVFFWMRRRAD